jgi:hypothetical protein
MERSRGTLGARVLDDDCRTMHIRCGHDFLSELRDAGLRGDFNAQINPYLQGPVTDTPDWLERRARFIADTIGPYQGLDYARVFEGARDEERRLAEASRDYARVVLWLEHDRYDQFVLLRCLAWFADHGAPPRLDLTRRKRGTATSSRSPTSGSPCAKASATGSSCRCPSAGSAGYASHRASATGAGTSSRAESSCGDRR